MLDRDQVLEIIQSELSLADSSTHNGVAVSSYEESLALYLGVPDGKEVEGRSHVVSTDIADAIEWMMPQIMKSFTQNNEVVVFDPVHEDDELQAEMESEYVYEVLMKQNDGFIILHQFVKDALMQKTGTLKVYYAERTKKKVTDWTGINEDQLNMLVGHEGVEILELSDYIDEVRTIEKQQQIQQQIKQMEAIGSQAMNSGQPIPPDQIAQFEQRMLGLQAELEKPVLLYNVKVSVERTKGQIYIDPVPPEEYRLNAQHNSINTRDARFQSHVLLKPLSDIVEEFGLPPKEGEKLPEGTSSYDRDYRFTLSDESIFYDHVATGDKSQKLIELAESYIRMDIDETGVAKLMKITTAGGDTPTDILLVEEVNSVPFISTTAILMSHKFKGLSITDRLKEIQSQKTSLWRNMFDNMYLQNNQRNVVIEGQVNMDDLLVSRPGGIIRVKRLDAIMPLATPQLGQDAYNMMDYLDRVRAGRTGVDPDGSATPQNIGDRVGSQGVERLMNAKEELVGLIVRVIAETGIKPLCVEIRDLSVQHVDSVVDFRFRGVWHKINPSEWDDRTSTTVRVGTGTGDHNQQVVALAQVLTLQEKLATSADGAVLVDSQKSFNTIDDYCKFSGLNGATRYFIDPSSPEGQNKSQQLQEGKKSQSEKEEQLQLAMADMQKKLADAETSKAETARLNVIAKTQVDSMKNQMTFQKDSAKAQVDMLKQQLDEANMVIDKAVKDDSLDLEKYRINTTTALELTRIETDKNTQEDKNFKENRGAVSE